MISLFSGCGGLDLGLGFRVRVAVENDKWARVTLCTNQQNNFFVFGDILETSPGEIMESAGLARGNALVVAGGPPCQSFSTAGKRGSFGDPRGGLFRNFAEVIDVVRPRFFVFENVRGLLSVKADDDAAKGSAFEIILEELGDRLGYQLVHGLLNAADYGTPQMRERVIVLGSRDHEFATSDIEGIVKPTHKGNWRTLCDGICGLSEPPLSLGYSDERKAILQHVPAGMNWRYLRDSPDFGPEFTATAMGGAWMNGGGNVGHFRRLAWDKPSPTLPTSPIQKSTSLCHPVETRPLSVQEYAALQEFPESYVFAGGLAQQYKQIGNAVPIGLGRAIGDGLREVMQ